MFTKRLATSARKPGSLIISTARVQYIGTDLKATESESSVVKAITKPSSNEEKQKPKKSLAQIDEELRMKMAGLAGDGGESGIQFEDGKPVSMKRGVRENMFRYI